MRIARHHAPAIAALREERQRARKPRLDGVAESKPWSHLQSTHRASIARALDCPTGAPCRADQCERRMTLAQRRELAQQVFDQIVVGPRWRGTALLSWDHDGCLRAAKITRPPRIKTLLGASVGVIEQSDAGVWSGAIAAKCRSAVVLPEPGRLRSEGLRMVAASEQVLDDRFTSSTVSPESGNTTRGRTNACLRSNHEQSWQRSGGCRVVMYPVLGAKVRPNESRWSSIALTP